jgi:hypothetical protein
MNDWYVNIKFQPERTMGYFEPFKFYNRDQLKTITSSTIRGVMQQIMKETHAKMVYAASSIQ